MEYIQFIKNDQYSSKFKMTYKTVTEYLYAHFTISLLNFSIYVYLPWLRKRYERPKYYGFSFHHGALWLYKGDDMKPYDVPIYTFIHHKHCIFGKNDQWLDVTSHISDDEAHEWFKTKIDYLDWGKDSLKDEDSLAKIYYGEWIDYDGEGIPAKYRIEKRIWRPKWLSWTSLFEKTKLYIEVAFQSEVGRKKDSWKGGVMNASFDILKGESPEDCFKRCNKERCLYW